MCEEYSHLRLVEHRLREVGCLIPEHKPNLIASLAPNFFQWDFFTASHISRKQKCDEMISGAAQLWDALRNAGISHKQHWWWRSCLCIKCLTAAGPPLPVFLNHLPHHSELLSTPNKCNGLFYWIISCLYKDFHGSFNIINASPAVVPAPSQSSSMHKPSHGKLQGHLNGTTGKD